MNDWITCRVCLEEWLPEDFKAAGSANERGGKVCNACFLAAHPRRKTVCTDCGRKMQTRGKAEAPKCRPCRRGQKPPMACRHCGKSARAVYVDLSGECFRCYTAHREGIDTARPVRDSDGVRVLRADFRTPATTEQRFHLLDLLSEWEWRRPAIVKTGDKYALYRTMRDLGWVEIQKVRAPGRRGQRGSPLTNEYRLTALGHRVREANRPRFTEREARAA